MSDYLNTRIPRAVSLLTLVGASVWFGSDYSIEAFLAVLLPLGYLSYLLLFVEEEEEEAEPSHHDRRLLIDFRKLLSTEGAGNSSTGVVSRLYRDQDMAAAFDVDLMEKGDKFVREWGDASHEFHDEELEEMKKALRSEIDELHHKYRVHTIPENGVVKLPPDHDRYWDESEYEYGAVAEELDRLATSVFDKHQKIVRAGLRKFAKSPPGIGN